METKKIIFSEYSTKVTQVSLIENLKYFLNNKLDFREDVEYNRQHFFELAEQNAKILDTLDADQCKIDFYFDRKGFGHLL